MSVTHGTSRHTVRSTPRRRASVARVTLALVVVATIGSWTTGPAGAHRWSAPPLVCGELPTTDVVLRSDLTCETPFHFVGPGPSVSIDLGGHTLTVPGDAGRCTAPGPCGAIAGAAAVRNGGVIGTLSDIGDIRGVIVIGDVEVGLGFAGTPGPASVRRTMVLNGSVRIWGPDATVADSLVGGAVVIASTNRAVRNLVIERNWIVRSPGDGVSIAPLPGSFPDDVTGRIRHNVILWSAGHGIAIGSGLWNVGALAIEGNALVGNGGDGFRSGTDATGPPTALGGPVTLTGNLALLNHGHGFDAGWMTGVAGTGIVDGGGNLAFANGMDPPCSGIDC